LLPLPTGSGRLENLPAYILQKNSEGAVLAEGPGLVIFDALTVRVRRLMLRRKCQFNGHQFRLLCADQRNRRAGFGHLGDENYRHERRQKLLAVQNFFSGKFTYSLWQGPDKLATTNETSLTRFLLHSRSGHCEYFATATVLLLRELGIPARYAVGYAVHESSHHGYVVRERDAHAWCLVWNKQTQGLGGF
jgi:hypothetical protein